MTERWTEILSKDELRRLGEYFGNQTDVVAAFLFGSAARGDHRADSDVDIAVLLDRSAPIAPLRAATLITEAMEILKRNDVDVVVLNSATPLLRHRVARDGQVLFARSNTDVAEFVIRAISEFVDTQPLRDLQSQQLRQRIRANLGRSA